MVQLPSCPDNYVNYMVSKMRKPKSQSRELLFISTRINLPGIPAAVLKSFFIVVKVTDHELGNPPKSHKNPS